MEIPGVSTIEVDVLSGSPNPSAVLGAQDELELTQLISELPVMAERPRPFDGLGYRGIVIHLGTVPGRHMRLARGVLSDEGGGPARADDDRVLFDWLVTRVESAGHVRLAAWLRSQP